MVTLRQRTTVATREPEPVMKEEGLCGDDLTILVDDDSSTDSAVKHLRGRWELASVLNFLNVFGPLVSYTFDEFDKMISDAVDDTEETDREDEEGKEQQSASLVGSDDSSEGNKMKSTEDVLPKREEEAPESDNDDVKEIEKIKEDSEGKREFNAKNRLRQRVTSRLLEKR